MESEKTEINFYPMIMAVMFIAIVYLLLKTARNTGDVSSEIRSSEIRVAPGQVWRAAYGDHDNPFSPQTFQDRRVVAISGGYVQYIRLPDLSDTASTDLDFFLYHSSLIRRDSH